MCVTDEKNSHSLLLSRTLANLVVKPIWAQVSKRYKQAKMEAFEKMCLFLPRVTADPMNEKRVTPESLALRKHFGGECIKVVT